MNGEHVKKQSNNNDNKRLYRNWKRQFRFFFHGYI